MIYRIAKTLKVEIDQDTAKAGRMLVAKLLDSSGVRGPDQDRIPAELIVRSSCGG